MKGKSNFFNSYNSANSSTVGIVKSEKEINGSNDDHISVPTKGERNSVTIIKRDGTIISERYYDNNGDAYLDIDYTDHGNRKMHPHVPHEHQIHFDDETPTKVIVIIPEKVDRPFGEYMRELDKANSYYVPREKENKVEKLTINIENNLD